MCGCTSTALARDTFKATISCTTWVHCTNCTDLAHHWSRITCTMAPIRRSLPSDSILLSFCTMQRPCTASTNGNDVWVFLDCSVYLLVDTSFSSNNQCSVIYPRIQACSRILHPNKTSPFWLLLEWQVFIEQMHCFCHCAVQDIALSLHCHCKCLLIVQVRILPKTTSLSIFRCHSPTLESATHPNHSFFHRTHFSVHHFKMSCCDEEYLHIYVHAAKCH